LDRHPLDGSSDDVLLAIQSLDKSVEKLIMFFNSRLNLTN